MLYEEPDTTTIGDQELLKELNKRVRINPDQLVPEGYYKVTEKEQILTYCLPDYISIKEEQKICIELLDYILNEAVGAHFLESLVSYESHMKVKPRIKQTNLAVGPPA